MIGEIPVSVAPMIPSLAPYQSPVILDGGTNCDVKYGIAEVYGFATSGVNKIPKVRRPTADSLLPPRVVLLPGATVNSDSSVMFKAADFSRNTLPVLAYMDSSSSAPTLGDSVGTVSGSWGLKVGNTGFVVVGVVSTTRVYVRPAGGGGGGGSATLVIAQAVGYGVNGVVDAKIMTPTADPALVPNYTLSSTTTVYRYFRG